MRIFYFADLIEINSVLAILVFFREVLVYRFIRVIRTVGFLVDIGVFFGLWD